MQKIHLPSIDFTPVQETHASGFFTPEAMRSPEQVAALKQSDAAVQQVMDADILVFSMPMYNFSIPAALKAYKDLIVCVKMTFEYQETVPIGLLKNNKAYIALSSGGVYDTKDLRQFDLATPYLKYILGFIDITDLQIFRIEATANPETESFYWEKAITSIQL